MKTAAPRLVRRALREERAAGLAPLGAGQGRVDRARGVIYGVKVVGKSSPNTHGVEGVDGTDYTPEALSAALPLYEGLKVNADHPPREKPGKERSSSDRLGKLRRCRIVGGELYADLHLLKSHPLAERLLEAAEADGMADCFALSHNATGRGEVRGGRYVITEIPEVRSVDLVADGGTNRSLFEGREMAGKKTTLRRWIQESKVEPALRRRLLEMGDDYAGAPMMDADMAEPEPDAGGDDGGWKQCLVDAIGKLVASEDAGDHELGAKILKLLKPEGEAPVEEGEEDDDGDEKKKKPVEEGEEDDDDKEKKAMESLQRDLKALKDRDAVRELCESLAFTPTRDQVADLILVADQKARKRLAEALKLAAGHKARQGAPRSAAPGVVRDVTESAAPRDAAEQATLLLR